MRFKKLDLNLLVALDHMMTLRSVSAAADKMFMSQSAMSNALNRLRQHFDDPLLVLVGKRMELTPRAEAMQGPLRDILVRIEATIEEHPEFDPSVSTRTFNVLVSDYTLRVLGAAVLREFEKDRAACKINFLSQTEKPAIMLERGAADLLVSPEVMLSKDHPSSLLFEDEYVVIACSNSVHAGQPMTRQRYAEAEHVAMRPPNSDQVAAEETLVQMAGVERNIIATTFSFSTLPHLLSGTDKLATVHGKLAMVVGQNATIDVFPLPFDQAVFRQALQWHSYREQDTGLMWLRSAFERAASTLGDHPF